MRGLDRLSDPYIVLETNRRVLYIEKYIESLMTIYDLLLIAAFLSTLATLVIVTYAAIRGRWSRVATLLKRWTIAAAAYMTIVVLVAIATPQRHLKLAEDLCFDDWCIAVINVNSTAIGSYEVTYRLSSRAKGISQRELAIETRMIDEAGKRFYPQLRDTDVPYSVLLAPGAEATLHRLFQVPQSSRIAGIEIAHTSGVQPGWFIIGQGPPIVAKNPIVPLNQ